MEDDVFGLHSVTTTRSVTVSTVSSQRRVNLSTTVPLTFHFGRRLASPKDEGDPHGEISATTLGRAEAPR